MMLQVMRVPPVYMCMVQNIASRMLSYVVQKSRGGCSAGVWPVSAAELVSECSMMNQWSCMSCPTRCSAQSR